MSITAKETVNGWTATNGDLFEVSTDEQVIYDTGSNTIFLHGFFDAETLVEIAAHMKSTQMKDAGG